MAVKAEAKRCIAGVEVIHGMIDKLSIDGSFPKTILMIMKIRAR